MLGEVETKSKVIMVECNILTPRFIQELIPRTVQKLRRNKPINLRGVNIEMLLQLLSKELFLTLIPNIN